MESLFAVVMLSLVPLSCSEGRAKEQIPHFNIFSASTAPHCDLLSKVRNIRRCRIIWDVATSEISYPGPLVSLNPGPMSF